MIEKCDICGRERDHVEDKEDYNPIQFVTGTRLGWYNGNDGSFCGGCLSNMIRKANE